jgi:hypothetical protein
MKKDSSPVSDQAERYLQGRMSEPEAAAFEEAYLANPGLVEELELTEKLLRGLEDIHAGERLSAPVRARFWSAPQFALAASTLLAVSLIAGGLLYRENVALRGATGLTAQSGPTRLLQLVAVRSDNAMELAAPAAGEWTVLLADPGFGPYQRFDAVVSRRVDDGVQAVWEARGLSPGFEGLIAIGMPGDLLTAGDYVVELSGRAPDWPADRANEPAARYRFRIAAAAP